MHHVLARYSLFGYSDTGWEAEGQSTFFSHKSVCSDIASHSRTFALVMSIFGAQPPAAQF